MKDSKMHTGYPVDLDRYCRGTPCDCGTETVLPLDGSLVEDRWGVKRVLNIPIKDPRNPLLMPDMPWEDSISEPNVIYDEQAELFRMWYTATDRNAHAHQFRLRDWNAEHHGYPYFICYAESVNGVDWIRPRLKNKPYKNHSNTNIVLTGRQKAQAARVTLNPPSTEQPERFLMTYKDNLPQGNGCLCLAYSDDGIHWRNDNRNPVFVGLQDTWHNMLYDSRRERWLMFTRPFYSSAAGVAGVANGPTEHNYKRRIAVMLGNTPYKFSSPRVVLWPDELDEPDLDHMMVSRIGNHFVGFLAQMGPPPKMEFSLHLSFSSDGLHWNLLPERPVYLPHGRTDAFDAGSISSAGGIVSVGDTNYIYYRGSRHGQAQGNRDNITGIGRAQFLTDRFVAQVGSHNGGFLLTRELLVTGPELVVNTTVANGYNSDSAAASVPPEFAVELVAFTEKEPKPAPIPGYTLCDCTTQPLDLLEQKVTWKDRENLAELVGKAVFIRFYLKNTGLYSFRFRASSS